MEILNYNGQTHFSSPQGTCRSMSAPVICPNCRKSFEPSLAVVHGNPPAATLSPPCLQQHALPCLQQHHASPCLQQHVPGSFVCAHSMPQPFVLSPMCQWATGNFQTSSPFLFGGTCWSGVRQEKAPSNQEVILTARKALQQSGWYYGALSWQEATSLLEGEKEGAFLVRDSASGGAPFALSVQTPQGPTSVRIQCEGGCFSLASERRGITHEFLDVIKLIQHYVSLSKEATSHSPSSCSDVGSVRVGHVWVDHQGKVFSPIRLVRPRLKEVPTLKHLSRLAVARGFSPSFSVEAADGLPLNLKQYLEEYKYHL